MNLTFLNQRLDSLESEIIRFRNGRAKQILNELRDIRLRVAAFIGTVAPAVPMQGEIMKLADLEKAAILHAVALCKNHENAARALGIGKTTLYRKLAEYDKEAKLSVAESPANIAEAISVHPQH